MSEIILAEHQGRTWLVGGEQYIDDLLANTLPGDVSIRFIACQSESEVRVLWIEYCGERDGGSAPWMIHPKIAFRARGKPAGLSVVFGQWSAMLDDNARAVLRDAAEKAAELSAAPVLLVAYGQTDGPKGHTDLTSLRATLIEAELTGLGVASARIMRATRNDLLDPAMEPAADRMDIVIKLDA